MRAVDLTTVPEQWGPAPQHTARATASAGPLTSAAELQAADPSAIFEVVRSRAGFDALEPEWNALFDRAGRSQQLFQSFNWCWHWCNHYLDASNRRGPRLAIVTARIDGRLVMIWPLVTQSMLATRIATFLGDPVSQYSDVIVEPGAGSQALLRAGHGFVEAQLRVHALIVRKVRADSAIAPLLARIGARETCREAAPFADLRRLAGVAEYEARLPSKDYKNRRRHRRRLAEQGTISVEVLHGGEPAAALASAAVAMKRSWLKDRGLLSRAFSDTRMDAFFADAVGSTARPTHSRVGVLRLDGRPVALEIAFRCKDRVASHIKVYDPDWEKHSPGQLLTEDMIKDIFAEAPAIYDLLAPNAAYKLDWADTIEPVMDWAVPTTLLGRLQVWGYHAFARPWLKQAIDRLPVGWRKALVTL